MKATFVISIALIFANAGLAATGARADPAVAYGQNPAAGHTLKVGDATIYYEVYGHGPAVVLLHGGLFGYIDEFEGIIPALARDRTVIAVALRGHGRSELGKGPLSYPRMADDVVAVTRQVTHEPVDLVGFSSGAITAFIVASKHPELVRSLVAIGGLLGAYGETDEALAGFRAELDVKELEKNLPPAVVARKKLNPDPAAFGKLAHELERMNRELVIVTKDEARSIKVPALVVVGDRDVFTRLDHVTEIYRLLPKGQLATIPGCGHVVLRCSPDVMLLLIQDFLTDNGGPLSPK